MFNMPCPKCRSRSTVFDTRPARHDGAPAVWRRRKCSLCGYRWTTYETAQVPAEVLVLTGPFLSPAEIAGMENGE